MKKKPLNLNLNLKNKLRDSATVATVAGGVFVAIALLGFVPNPFVAEHGFFATNTAHNILFAVTGGALMASTKARLAEETMFVVGALYAMLGILGVVSIAMSSSAVLGFIRVNVADDLLNLVLGAGLLYAAVQAKSKKR
jgi:hypothetical protein